MQLLYLNPHDLEPDPDGIRDDPGDVDSLAETIAEQGMLQPLGVVRMNEGRYRVVYGNRRRAAAIKLNLEKIPCILLDADDRDSLLQQLVENVQREELNDMEKARAFSRLRSRIAEMHGKQSESELDDATGKAVGLTGRTVRRYLGLLDLPQEVQALLRRRELTVTQAQHLRRIANKRTQIELAQAAVDEGMSAADLSRLAGYFAANPNLTLETALQALEQNAHMHQRPDTGMPAAEVPGAGGPLGKTSVASVDREESEDDLWDEDEDTTKPGEDDDGYLSVDEETVENQPRNKARVFRIRSLDHMVEETDRLSRAYAEGDLVKWVKKDESAPFKLRLLLKQLETLVNGLKNIAQEQGWEGE
jgi:ParB family chromosome partitioning protein